MCVCEMLKGRVLCMYVCVCDKEGFHVCVNVCEML